MEVFISDESLNISVERIVTTTIDEFSNVDKTSSNYKSKIKNEFDAVETIKSAAQLVELKDLFGNVTSFAKAFKGVLDDNSVKEIENVLKEKVADNVNNQCSYNL